MAGRPNCWARAVAQSSTRPAASLPVEFGHSRFRVGQIGNLRPIGNRPVGLDASLDGPIANRPQVTNLPHIRKTQMSKVVGQDGILPPIVKSACL